MSSEGENISPPVKKELKTGNPVKAQAPKNDASSSTINKTRKISSGKKEGENFSPPAKDLKSENQDDCQDVDSNLSTAFNQNASFVDNQSSRQGSSQSDPDDEFSLEDFKTQLKDKQKRYKSKLNKYWTLNEKKQLDFRAKKPDSSRDAKSIYEHETSYEWSKLKDLRLLIKCLKKCLNWTKKDFKMNLKFTTAL